MRKFLSVLLIGILLCVPAYATQRNSVLADEVEINATTTDTGWLQQHTGNTGKITFFITSDSSSSTQAATVAVTVQASADGTNWANIRWYDLIGGTTAQVNETVADSGDETYLMWLDRDILFPHIRIKVSNEGTWDTQTNTLTVTIIEDK